MKKVLLLGDSIRLSYQSRVKELMEGKAEVFGPEENGRFAKYTLWNINLYLSFFGAPDIVHWNNGIWDTYTISEDIPIFTNLDEYLRDMRLILNEIRKKCPVVIFANTTPVREGFLCNNNDRIDKYNKAIEKLMREESVPINDLNSLVKKNLDLYVGDDLLHLTQEGVEVCAKQVAHVISEYL